MSIALFPSLQTVPFYIKSEGLCIRTLHVNRHYFYRLGAALLHKKGFFEIDHYWWIKHEQIAHKLSDLQAVKRHVVAMELWCRTEPLIIDKALKLRIHKHQAERNAKRLSLEVTKGNADHLPILKHHDEDDTYHPMHEPDFSIMQSYLAKADEIIAADQDTHYEQHFWKPPLDPEFEQRIQDEMTLLRDERRAKLDAEHRSSRSTIEAD